MSFDVGQMFPEPFQPASVRGFLNRTQYGVTQWQWRLCLRHQAGCNAQHIWQPLNVRPKFDKPLIPILYPATVEASMFDVSTL